MTKTEEEYPSDWNSVESAKSEGSEFLKIKSGEKVRLRILAGPLAFQQLYLEGNKKGFNLPFNSQIPGYKPRKQYAFEVLVLDGASAGDHKVWAAGQKVAEQLSQIRTEWGDIKKCDIVLSKTGEKLETKWQATPVPASKLTEAETQPTMKLSEKIIYATKEQLDALPPAPVGASV